MFRSEMRQGAPEEISYEGTQVFDEEIVWPNGKRTARTESMSREVIDQMIRERVWEETTKLDTRCATDTLTIADIVAACAALDANDAPVTATEVRQLATRYVDDNPKTIHGQAKPQLHLVPGTAMIALAGAMQHGLAKYGPANWRDAPVSRSTYSAAALRHIFAMIDGEDIDPESGEPHAAHVMGCMAILIDAEAQGTLKDDRPTHGKTSKMLAERTRPIPA
ncbi:dATP/dGTP diphosphohydrolase domain-containing protein [Phenylobacterium sp.]|uniref:dATP/dGTP diphosphohydrolase domain-containing protein n=1 Tax=Phenylobacterium sp. TaxID=1871053 RepID=UPI002737BD1C|nr:dATP/dGTP diphosphohydrolase domain-containing protein [Phenylobacterium sp.]MDP3869915.1 DUF5664 domain-containing protein [Phenylobacterium sp.]